MGFAYRDKVNTLRAVIFFEAGIIGLLFLALYGTVIGWQRADAEQSLHIPPDLRSGAVVKKGDVPPANAYAFAHYIFQQLNRWAEEGSRDYGKNIFRLAAYLTPRFRAQLEADLDLRGKNGELASRTRGTLELPGAGYEERRVDIQGNGAWVVWLDLQILEWVRGLQVKDTVVRYPLRVVRYDVDREKNPWGLALDGYAEEPRRLSQAEVAALTGKARESGA